MATRMTRAFAGQWWNAPTEERFRAYYMNMRLNYGMTAVEAIAYARRTFQQYPDFMRDPMGTLRNAINKEEGK